ncbi:MULTISPECIES: HNH endonuclease signature motif containing protein [Rodentibacter]|uniref:HNH endonuclease signature motif containing protein n=1 Tax=Rodentibacter TaxID=1960084 RepID=UPI001CFE8D62|nr:HNH endonuclease signature motif containing protein [Rodentibacter sp. JRC1]GJI56493.1 hypothetical protein HEMROJRC1_16050 [Rodentibacter sp. JRC1]
MKLNINLTALEQAVRQMGEQIKFSTGFGVRLPPLKTAQGVQIQPGDIEWIKTKEGSELPLFQGEVVILFIPDHTKGRQSIEAIIQNGGNGNRLHFSNCETLEKMRQIGRYERYRATNNLEGLVEITALNQQGQIVSGEVVLKACKNCLSQLNYKNYAQTSRQEKNEIWANFSFKEFFEIYKPYFHTNPDLDLTPGYSDDWKYISQREKEKRDFCCDECGVNLRQYRHLLHTHHKNGVTKDNRISNLAVLCVECHCKQPKHEHMSVLNEDKQLLAKLRAESAWDLDDIPF